MKHSFNMYELKKILSQVGIDLNKKQEKQFQKYIELLLAWNKRTNLISRKDESQIVDNHILESLAFLLSFELSPGMNVVDVGSGAGFPALPLSLVRPEVDFFLVESKRMKSLFLRDVVSQLMLDNVEVVCERVENISQDIKYANRFDFAVTRAVASLEVVYGWVEKILKPTGLYIAWKGGDVDVEVRSLKERFIEVKVDVVKMDERFVPFEKKRVFVQVKRI